VPLVPETWNTLMPYLAHLAEVYDLVGAQAKGVLPTSSSRLDREGCRVWRVVTEKGAQKREEREGLRSDPETSGTIPLVISCFPMWMCYT